MGGLLSRMGRVLLARKPSESPLGFKGLKALGGPGALRVRPGPDCRGRARAPPTLTQMVLPRLAARGRI